MLLSFSVRNFRSFRDEQTLFMTRSRRIAAHSVDGATDPGINTATGVYGSNASGKSNLLLALDFMASAVRGSHSGWSPEGGTPFDPFRLDSDSQHLPSRFEVEVELDGTRFQYGFEITAEKVHQEWLYAYPKGRRQTWFERDSASNDEWYFGKGMSGQNRVISELTRPNSLFLSAAATSGHEKTQRLYKWFANDIRFANQSNFSSRLQFTLEDIEAEPDTARQLKRLLRFADLGICDIRVIKQDLSTNDQRIILGAARELISSLGGPDVPTRTDFARWLEQYRKIELQHSSSTSTEPVSLPFEAESLGTRSLIALGGPVLRALRHGRTLVVDEIDTSLHPNLVAEIVRLFKSVGTNPHRAQLIFTSHDTSLLGNLVGNEPPLDRDQTWFVEKDQDGASKLFPLTDFHPRKQENLERGYLQGRYGAVPFINMQKLVPDIRNSTDDA